MHSIQTMCIVVYFVLNRMYKCSCQSCLLIVLALCVCDSFNPLVLTTSEAPQISLFGDKDGIQVLAGLLEKVDKFYSDLKELSQFIERIHSALLRSQLDHRCYGSWPHNEGHSTLLLVIDRMVRELCLPDYTWIGLLPYLFSHGIQLSFIFSGTTQNSHTNKSSHTHNTHMYKLGKLKCIATFLWHTFFSTTCRSGFCQSCHCLGFMC